MNRQPHALVIPFPAQGHVAPLMKLALHIAAHDVKVTFVNTDFIHEKVMVLLAEGAEEQSLISFTSISDGLEPQDERSDWVKVLESVHTNMPGFLEDFIVKFNQSNMKEQITCVVADTSVGWALEVANKLGILAVALWPAGVACLALALHVPQLLEAEIIDNDGTVLKDEPISLSKNLPAWSSSEIGWDNADIEGQKFLFRFYSIVPEYKKFYDLLLCNSIYELDSASLQLIPNILPIGPLLASNHSSTYAGNFWHEDSTCIEWLDKQSPGSVIYVAFGSSTMASMEQLEELALGLELTGQPFLWVLRSDFMNGSVAKLPEGFEDRVSLRANFVKWAPQEKVLGHSSIACFMSHCGWNSTMEGLSNGVPFLCWPYHADQFSNKNHICNVWKTGLELTPDGDGIVTRHELSTKAKTLLSFDTIKANALHVKELVTKSSYDGGSSCKNFKSFIERIKSI